MPVGPFGKSLDARKQKPALPANPDYNAPPLTVECLAKLDSSRGFNILVASEPKTSGTHWELYTYASSGVLSVYMPGYAPAEIRSDAVVTDGAWHYCAMTFDGRTVRLYVDGKLARAERVRRQAGMAPVAGPLCVGHIAGTDLGCDGLLDEVRVSSVLRDIRGVPSAPFEDDSDTLALWHFDAPLAATGMSREADPFKAGAEAAFQARKALGAAEVRSVIVCDGLGGGLADRQRMIEGIGWFFDSSLVYGCSGFGVITRQSNRGTVAVLALSEAVHVSVACDEVAGGHEACGRRLAATLRQSALSPRGAGRLVVLLGDCHVPANDALVKGFLAGYGSHVPVVGGSCPQGGFVYDAGRVRQGANLALLMAGDFSVTLSLAQASGPDDIAPSAGRAAGKAAGDRPSGVGLTLAFDCVSRCPNGGALREELDAVTARLPAGTIFGFYGSGEIGATSAEAHSVGVGGHLAMACLHMG